MSAAAPAARPVAFGEPGHQLFGWYHPPALHEGQARDCLVVMSNPIGYDAICTHRHYRILARQLAHAGFAVLRYDHHGTGDSAGSDEDPERYPAWIAGVHSAVAYGRQCSGASQVALFGVRMGGTLAMAAAAEAPLAQCLLAWSPFPSGSAYLREMRALRMMRDADSQTASVIHDAGADLGEEAAGYLLTASTIAELGGLNLLNSNAAPAPAVLLLARDDLPESEKLARHLGKLGCELTALKVPGYAGMMKDTFDAVVPQQALAEIGAWLAARHPLRPAPAASALAERPRLIAGSRGAEASVVEAPVQFGEGGQFFGIVSESLAAQGERGRTGIVLVSVGSNHHIGPNRMYVTQARALASLGFVALRMDIGGVGESQASAGREDNHLYAMHSVADVEAAVRYLREQRQIQNIVLIGVCSGAYLSYHAAAADPEISSIVLINPQTFHWKDGDSLQLKSRTGIRAMSFYRSRMLSVDTWRRLLSGQVQIGIITAGVAAMLRKRLRLRIAAWLSAARAGSEGASSLDVRTTFRRFLRRGMNCFLLYSANDGGLNEMETQLGQNAAALGKHSHFKLQIVEGADHTFTPLWAQRRLLDLLTQHLMRLYG